MALAAAGVIGVSSLEAAEAIKLVPAGVYSDTVLSGYVDTSAIWRPGDASDSGGSKGFPDTLRSPGRLYDNPEKHNGFNLNAVSVALEKPLDEAAWSAGYRVQLLAGPDRVLRSTYTLGGGKADVGLNEAYVTARAPIGNGLSFRLGYFTSPVGYEVYDSYRNPNYSRSYGYYLEPKAHTGFTASYEFTPWLSAMGGVANNFSPFVDAKTGSESGKTYLALLTVTGAGFGWPDASFTFGYTGGNTATGAPTDEDPRIQHFYAGLRLPTPVQGLGVGVAYDYQIDAVANQPAIAFEPAGPKHTYATAIALYLDYHVGRFSFNTRFEYARGTPGYTIFGSHGAFDSVKPLNGPDPEEFFGFTATAGYQFWENVISRLEFRYDRDLAGGPKVFGSAADPRRDSYTLALNVIYSF